MLTFWKIYFICLGIAIFFSLLTFVLFNEEDGDKIPIPYVIFAICICAIPGLGMLGTLLLIIGIVGLIVNGDILPKDLDDTENKQQRR